jgi:hypothetical protein
MTAWLVALLEVAMSGRDPGDNRTILVCLSPEGFIYWDPAPDMRFLGLRGWARCPSTQWDFGLGIGFSSSNAKRSGFHLLRTPPAREQGSPALVSRRGVTSRR